ncbi:MAG: SDR family NAD(P)-dependent oxidoreductase [Chitinophagales bacterium]
MDTTHRKTALITGASKGLGLELARALAQKKWRLIINARNANKLYEVQQELLEYTEVEAISGDVIDEIHLLQFPDRAAKWGGLDLVINNASTLGISPQPHLLDYPIEVIHNVFHTNVIAPLSLLQKVKNYLNHNAKIINISSDAGIEAYEGWGAYGASKAALEHLSAILNVENPQWSVYWIDPGDMRTDMHQAAFPNEDISDRPLPKESVPGFLKLIEGNLPSGRYVSQQLSS